MTNDQVWWPILGNSSEHTPGAAGSHLCCGTRGAVGGSVPCSRAPHRGIEGGQSAVHSLPQLHLLLAWDLNLQPFDYETGYLTIRPRLPLWYVICAVVCDRLIKHQSYVARECDTGTKSCHHLSSLLYSKLIWICNCNAIRLWGGIRSLACLYVFPPLSLSIPLSRKCRSVKQSVAMVTG